MSANYQEFTAKIFLNDSQAENRLKALSEKATALRDKMNKALNQKGGFSNKDWKSYQRELKKTEEEMRQLSTTSQFVDRVLGNLSGSSVKELQLTIRALNRELSNGTVPRNSEAWKALTEQLRLAKTELKKIQNESRAAAEALSESGNSKGFIQRGTDFLNKNWGAITQVWAAFTGLSDTIRQTTQAYADMEEAMANVRKYTGQTSEEVHAMNEEFKAIDTRTSREQLNELAGAAGRLGITSHDDIMEFVDAADKINVALGDDLGKGAVDQIGKLAMAFGEDDTLGLRGAMLATGSAINELAQHSSANAGYMVDFAARVAGIGKQAGLTQAQIIGLGSVLDENMQRDEMASTALTGLISKIAADSAKFAEIAGLNIDEFSEKVRTDMNGALLDFFDALNKKGGLIDLAPMFNQMGLDGARASSVLTVLANKIDDVRKNQKRAIDAYAQGSSVIDEFNVQNTTVQAEIDKAKKKFHDLSVELGEKLNPIVKYTISTGSLLVKALSQISTFVLNNTTVIMGLTAAIVSYKVEMLLANNATKIATVLGSAYATVLKTMRIAALTLTRKISVLTIAQHAYNAAVKAFPAMWITTIVTGLVMGMKKLSDKYGDINWRAKELNKQIKEQNERYDQQRKRIEYLLPIAQNAKKSMEERNTAINQLKQICPEYFKNLDTETAKNYELAGALSEVTKKQKEANRLKYKTIIAQYNSDANEYYAKYGQSHIKKVENRRMQPGIVDVERMEQSRQKRLLDEKRVAALAAVKALKELNKVEKEEAKTKDGTGDGDGNGGGNPPANNNPSGGTTTGDPKQDQYNKDLAAAKRHYEQELMVETNRYNQGLIDLQEYNDKEAKLKQQSFDAQLAVMEQYGKQDTDEYRQMQLDKQAAQTDSDNKMRDLSLQNLEQMYQSEKSLLNAQLYDKESAIYGNEEALDQALLQLDIAYIEAKMSHYNKTSDEYVRLEAEKQQKLNDDKIEKQRQYEERKAKIMQDYVQQDYTLLEQDELALLQQIYENNEITAEQHHQALLAIKEKYAKKEQTVDEQTAENAKRALSIAMKQAGDMPEYDTSGTDMGVSAISGIFQIVKYRQEVNERLKALYGEDYKNNEEYEKAKEELAKILSENITKAMMAAYSGINNILSASSAYSQACSDYETAKIQANYDKQIEAAGNNSKKKEKLEKKRDEELRKVKTKANKKAMKIEIAQAIAGTAMSAIAAYASAADIPKVGWILAPIAAAAATAAGMLQVATIKKQHQAEEAGYYEGGFTSGRNYRRQAGVVHEGEFVANHQAVNNPAILPALQLIDQAQKSNTVSRLTADDVSRAIGSNAAQAVVAPIVNVQTSNDGQEEMRQSLNNLNSTVAELQRQLSEGITAIASIDGKNGVANQLRRYNRLKQNA